MESIKRRFSKRSTPSSHDWQGFWEEELTDEQEKALIEKATREISKRKLEVPAILALEVHRPLAGIGGQSLVAFAPFIAPFVGSKTLDDWSRFLLKPGAVGRLIERIEESANERSEKK